MRTYALHLGPIARVPPEPVADYLLRLQWASHSGGRMTLSALGRAVIRANGAGTVSHSEPIFVTLEPNSAVSYVTFARAVNDAGAGMVVDPYFKADQLDWFATSTSISRILMSSRNRQQAEVELVAVALGSGALAGHVEIRATASVAFHDRAIVHEDRSLTVIGTSINGLKKHLSYLTTLTAEDAASFRDRLESLWKTANDVAPKIIFSDEPGVKGPSPSAVDEQIVTGQ